MNSSSSRFRQQMTMMACMYGGYGAMMISRQMVTILSPALLADPDLGFTVKDIGDILAWGTIGAMAGKVIWGPLADRIGGRLTFLIGIVLSALMVTAFGFSSSAFSFTLFASLLYMVKSSGWPGMTKIVGEWFHPSKYGRTWGILSTSSRASVVLGTLTFGWLLGQFHWRTVTFVSVGLALAIYLVCRLFLREKPEDPNFLKEEGAAAEQDPEMAEEARKALENKEHHPLNGTNVGQGLLAFSKSMRVWCVVIMLMALTCAMAFLDFMPAYLMQVFKLTPSKAAMASSVMPLGSLAGLIGCIFFYDRFSLKGLRRVLALTLVIATLCIVTLKFLPSFGLSEDANFPIALCFIILFGVMTSPAYYIPMSIFSIEYGGPHSATLVCLIDMFGFAASATFGFVSGRLVDGPGGWDSFMNLLIAVGVAATVSTWMFMHGEYKAAHSSS